jgi:DNA (cytosine-5)-methyltransferase 1
LELGLEQLGYLVSHEILQLADYGVPQFRRRLVLLAGRGFPIEIPKPTHAEPQRARTASLRPWKTVRDAIGDLPEPPKRSEVIGKKIAPAYEWHYARDVAPIVRQRLEHALKTGGRRHLPVELQLACHRNSDGYFDVYGAMHWDRPAPTITSGCTNASKGRFGHPGSPRPLTAREAARIQTFPLNYSFRGTNLDSIAAQIGNALPCSFARLLGRTVSRALVVR